MPRASGIFFFFELGKAKACVVVDGLGGKRVEAFGILAELIDEFTEVVAGDASAIEYGGQVVVIDSADEADVGVFGAKGDGSIHAIAA